MKAFFKKIPTPICGVALGLAALGNLLQSYSEVVRTVCGCLSGLLLILYILRCILHPADLRADLKNPITASVAGTFPMAWMLLSVYLKPVIGAAAKYLWFAAIALHIALIVYFTVAFLLKRNLQKVFASYFIVYVGIVVAAVTAPAYELLSVGTAAFWFGFVCLIGLLVLVTVRYCKYPSAPEPAKALICIYAAPVSLCVAGYVQSVAPKSPVFLLIMYAVSCILYLFALVKLLSFLKLPFYPSCASFTFPFVISAIASKQTMACAANLGCAIPALSAVVLIQTIFAVCAVVYTCVRYALFLCKKPAAV